MIYLLELNDCKLLGSGAEGSVYLTPEGYALKQFKSQKGANKEVFILNKAKESRFFPNVLIQISNLVVREFVPGINLYEYIEKNDLSKNLSIEIIELIEDLKRLKFKRINVRNSHIFISKEEKLMVIDPRKSFTKNTPYPKEIIKILIKLNKFDSFLNHVTDYNPKLLNYWVSGYSYVAARNKLSRYL